MKSCVEVCVAASRKSAPPGVVPIWAPAGVPIARMSTSSDVTPTSEDAPIGGAARRMARNSQGACSEVSLGRLLRRIGRPRKIDGVDLVTEAHSSASAPPQEREVIADGDPSFPNPTPGPG